MKKIIFLTPILLFLFFVKLYAQVGIGTINPNSAAILHVDLGSSLTKGFLITGSNLNGASVPNLGAGSRLMFYPGKSAFRAGTATGTEWDDANIGNSSVAMGYFTKASGSTSTALGSNTTASGGGSTALGYGSTASGSSSTALGNFTTASGSSSTAIGESTIASGQRSTAMGLFTNATGLASTAMGFNLTASGDLTTAMGYLVSTNGYTGAFAIGDSDPNNEGRTFCGAGDQLVARFWNGYYFLTSGTVTRFGVQIAHNGNSWVSICDKNRKENFETLDGDEILQKLSKINFTSWNYKMQDPRIYRHYGIMAQDFYNAFGHDKFGVIGNDTTVNPIDMIGIDMSAIQALDKRTNELRKEMKTLKDYNAILAKEHNELAELKKENEDLRQTVMQLQKSFNEQQKSISESQQQIKKFAVTQNSKINN